jgi:transposase InsO family protein
VRRTGDTAYRHQVLGAKVVLFRTASAKTKDMSGGPYKCQQNMSRPDDQDDNAFAESYWSRLKDEVMENGDFLTLADALIEIGDYSDNYRAGGPVQYRPATSARCNSSFKLRDSTVRQNSTTPTNHLKPKLSFLLYKPLGLSLCGESQ